MDLFWRPRGRRMPSHVVRVHGVAVRECTGGYRVATRGQIPCCQERLQSVERGRHRLPVCVRRARRQCCAVGLGDDRRPCPERVEQRAARGVVDNLRPDLIRDVAEGDARRHHPVGHALLHQRDRLVDERTHALEPGDDVLVVGAGCRRHLRDHARHVLLNTLDLVHRHTEVMRHHAADGHGIVVELEALCRSLEQVAIQIVADLILGGQAGTIDVRNPLDAVFQVGRASVDRWLGIVGPARILTGVADRGRGLRVLRHPVLPVFVELGAKTLGRARRVRRGTGHRQQGEHRKDAEQQVVAHAPDCRTRPNTMTPTSGRR